MSRVDQYSLTLTIDGQDFGVWDKMSGGEIDSEESTYRPGGMAPQISLGGSITVGAITISRLYMLTRDVALVPTLKSKIGKGQCVVNRQTLDVDGNVFGRPIIYTGKLKTLTFPDVDSEGSDAALIELTISPDGNVG